MSHDISVELHNTRLYRHYLAIRNEVMKHKWIESEKAHKDVGFEYALVDWIVNYKTRWDEEHKTSRN